MAEGFGITIDTRRAETLASTYKNQARRARAAIVSANTTLAKEMQSAEARELRKQVAAGGRVQRSARGRPRLATVLQSPLNRRVSASGFSVNDTKFLDGAAGYWRQLEQGAQGRTQLLSGMFVEGGRLVRPSGNRTSGRFIQFKAQGAHSDLATRVEKKGRGAVVFTALVGPLNPYRYIETGEENARRRWATGHGLGVYQRAFTAHGLNLLADFRTATGGPVRHFSDLAE